MERRNAIIAMLASTIGLMSGKSVMAEDNIDIQAMNGSHGTGSVGVFQFPKGSVTFNLDSYTDYQFILGDHKVTLTPTEIMDALRDHQ